MKEKKMFKKPGVCAILLVWITLSYFPDRLLAITPQVSAGGLHSVALKSDGTLWGWGSNFCGQLGDSSNVDRNIPTKIGIDNDWEAIAAGSSHCGHSLALKSDGSLWASGPNWYGELGDGSNVNKNIPIQIGTDNDWKAIAAGGLHSLALKSDGSLWAWGGNSSGQLGDGTKGLKNVPTHIGTDNDWKVIAAGGFHSLALKTDATLWAWGWNEEGQLGNGAASYQIYPVKIGSLIIPSISLQSPVDGTFFDACSLTANYQPTFQWTASEAFEKFTLLFSFSPTDFSAPIARENMKWPKESWTPSPGTWKKILASSNNAGTIRDLYWTVVGTKADGTTLESEVRSFRVQDPQAVAIHAPSDQAVLSPGALPTFDFATNCNTRFRLEFSSLESFSDPSKMKGFNFMTKDPNVEEALHKTLTRSQWNNVKKLVGTETGYFRIKAWDGLERETVSEVKSFSVQ